MAKILIVDDDKHTSAMLAKLLTTKGYETREEANGAAALIAAHEDLPNLILMDLYMPILDGEEAISALKRDKRTANIPIIVLTASEDRTFNVMLSGASIYLVKPPDPRELVSIIERILTEPPEDSPAA